MEIEYNEKDRHSALCALLLQKTFRAAGYEIRRAGVFSASGKGGFYDDYMDFDVPWNISISYNFTYSRPSPYRSPTISQIVNFSGDLSLTPKWKLTFQSGYDIKNKEVTSTSFSVTRDLHCWEMTFNCMPFGQHQSYNFEIHVRSSLLRDLKLTKRDSWYDRRL